MSSIDRKIDAFGLCTIDMCISIIYGQTWGLNTGIGTQLDDQLRDPVRSCISSVDEHTRNKLEKESNAQ